MAVRPGDPLAEAQKQLFSRFNRIRQSPPQQKAGKFDNAFSAALRKYTGTAPAQRTGLTVADYRANQVRSYPVVNKEAVLSTSTRSSEATENALLEKAPGAKKDIVPAQSTNSKEESSTRAERRKIDRCIRKASRNYHLSSRLIQAVIQAESNYQAGAVSPAGAQGLMQLMPGTANELGVTDPFDIEQNIDGGARYLRKMLDMFNGDERLALAAYNAGPGTVLRHGGIPPYRETQEYVERVLGNRG